MTATAPTRRQKSVAGPIFGIMLLVAVGLIPGCVMYSCKQSARASSERAVAENEEKMFVAAASGRVLVGMKREHVRKAWGDPLRVVRSGAPGASSETWYYSGIESVSFASGIVQSVSSRK